MFKIFNREKIIPGNEGRDCLHNGYGKKHCACDECDWFLCCFPEYEKNHFLLCEESEIPEYGECVDCENCIDNTCPGKKKGFIQRIKEKLSQTT